MSGVCDESILLKSQAGFFISRGKHHMHHVIYQQTIYTHVEVFYWFSGPPITRLLQSPLIHQTRGCNTYTAFWYSSRGHLRSGTLSGVAKGGLGACAPNVINTVLYFHKACININFV